MTDIDELSQNLKRETEAHLRTKIAFHELKYQIAHLEMLSDADQSRIFIRKLQSENSELKMEIFALKEQIRELNGMMLPGVNISDVKRKYDFTRSR